MKNAHPKRIRSELSSSSLRKTAGFGTLLPLLRQQVVGLHRAIPSATLDKAVSLSRSIITRSFALSTVTLNLYQRPFGGCMPFDSIGNFPFYQFPLDIPDRYEYDLIGRSFIYFPVLYLVSEGRARETELSLPSFCCKAARTGFQINQKNLQFRRT